MKRTLHFIVVVFLGWALQSCTKSELESPSSSPAQPSAIIVNPTNADISVIDREIPLDPNYSSVNDDDDDETGAPPKELK